MFADKTVIVRSAFFLLLISLVILVGASHTQTDRWEYAEFKHTDLSNGASFYSFYSPNKRVMMDNKKIIKVNRKEILYRYDHPFLDFANQFTEYEERKVSKFTNLSMKLQILNNLGNDGWELIDRQYVTSMDRITDKEYFYTFKRRK